MNALTPGKALRKRRELLMHLETMLCGDDAENTLGALGRFLRKEENPWPKNKDVAEALRFQATLSVVPADPFVAADHFKVDCSPTAAVKIVGMNKEFKEHFLPVVEEGAKPADLVSWVVPSTDSVPNPYYPPYLFLLLKEPYGMSLAHLWEALRNQRGCEYKWNEKMVLDTTTGNGTFLFVFDKQAHHLWTLNVFSKKNENAEDGSGWQIDAIPFGKRILHRDTYPRVLSIVK